MDPYKQLDELNGLIRSSVTAAPPAQEEEQPEEEKETEEELEARLINLVNNSVT